MSQNLLGSSCWLFSKLWRQNVQVTILSWGVVGIPSSKLRWRAGKSPCSLVINSGKQRLEQPEKCPVGKKGSIDPNNQILMVLAVSFQGSSFRGCVSPYEVQLESTQSLKCDAISTEKKSAKVGSMVQSQCCRLLLCLWKTDDFFLCLFKAILFNFYYGKSPINHHLAEYCLFCPTTSSKSKFWCSLLKKENGERRK